MDNCPLKCFFSKCPERITSVQVPVTTGIVWNNTTSEKNSVFEVLQVLLKYLRYRLEIDFSRHQIQSILAKTHT